MEGVLDILATADITREQEMGFGPPVERPRHRMRFAQLAFSLN